MISISLQKSSAEQLDVNKAYIWQTQNPKQKNGKQSKEKKNQELWKLETIKNTKEFWKLMNQTSYIWTLTLGYGQLL